MNPEPWKPLPGVAAVGIAAKSQKPIPLQNGEMFWGATASAGSMKSGDKDKEDNSDSEGSSEGKGKLELMPVWQPTKKEKQAHRDGNRMSLGSVDISEDNTSGMQGLNSWESEHDDEFHNKPGSRFIINPDSRLRIAWDLASL